MEEKQKSIESEVLSSQYITSSKDTLPASAASPMSETSTLMPSSASTSPHPNIPTPGLMTAKQQQQEGSTASPSAPALHRQQHLQRAFYRNRKIPSQDSDSSVSSSRRSPVPEDPRFQYIGESRGDEKKPRLLSSATASGLIDPASSPNKQKQLITSSPNATTSSSTVSSSAAAAAASEQQQRICGFHQQQVEPMDTTASSITSSSDRSNHPPQRSKSLHRQPSQDHDVGIMHSAVSMAEKRAILTASASRHSSFDTIEKTVVVDDIRSVSKRNSKGEGHVVTVTPPTISYPLQTIPDTRQHIMTRPHEDTTYPITCGTNVGELVWKKFICPGINAKCVKVGESWLTPKEFVNFAGKSTLKDWKRAIRIKGTMLRKLIENGDLNYYDHDNNCSNQCRSNKSFDEPAVQPAHSEPSSSASSNQQQQQQQSHTSMSGINDDTCSTSSYPQQQQQAASASQQRRQLSSHHKIDSSSHPNDSLERSSSSEDSGIYELMGSTSCSTEKAQELQIFWNSMIRMELFDQIMGDALNMFKLLMNRCSKSTSISPDDAVTLTNTVTALEIIPMIRHRINFQKSNVDKQTEDLGQMIQDMEKRLAEQKKFEQDLKRKSKHLTDVMSLTPNEKRPKMLKFVRQKAVSDSRPNPTLSDIVRAWSDFSVGTSTPPINNSMVLAATSRLQQHRDVWPQIQAAQTQMARMNVSDPATQAALGIGPMFFTHNIHAAAAAADQMYNPNPSIHQALFSTVVAANSKPQAPPLSQQQKQMSREGTPQSSNN